MEPLCKTLRLSAASDADLARAAAILRAGGTVAFPTETVYGLGANALDPAAVARIFTAKLRPAWDPLIVHLSGPGMLAQVAQIPPEHQNRVARLIAAFWPGPLTILLPRNVAGPAAVPDAVTAGRPLVGVRMPAHPAALELIRLAGVPVAAPSANRFGHTSPTTSEHVLEDLDGRIDAVLDGGPARVGIESTVLAVTQTPMLIYRPGTITAEMLAEVANCPVRVFQPAAAEETAPAAPLEALPSPGISMRHYAPRAQLVLVEVAANGDRTHALHAAIEQFEGSDQIVGVLLPEDWDASYAEEIFPLGEWGDDDAFAARIFAGLRALDARGVDVIVSPVPSGDGLALALRDRLEKAARPERPTAGSPASS